MLYGPYEGYIFSIWISIKKIKIRKFLWKSLTTTAEHWVYISNGGFMVDLSTRMLKYWFIRQNVNDAFSFQRNGGAA